MEARKEMQQTEQYIPVSDEIVEALQLKEGDPFKLERKGDKWVLKKGKRQISMEELFEGYEAERALSKACENSELTLEELFANYNDDYKPKEISFGPPRGREIW